MSDKTGGPAFPGTSDNYAFTGEPGMTLRDYFAAKALHGWRDCNTTSYEQDAEAAYAMADAMLQERAK